MCSDFEPNQTNWQGRVAVLRTEPLPRALRIAEVDVHLRGHGEALVFGYLQPSVPGQGPSQRRGELTNLRGQCGGDGRCIFAGHFNQYGETRVSFDEGCDVTVAGAASALFSRLLEPG